MLNATENYTYNMHNFVSKITYYEEILYTFGIKLYGMHIFLK